MQRGYAEAIKRIDFLFKALEFKELFSKEFVDFAIEEIQSALTPPEESKVEFLPLIYIPYYNSCRCAMATITIYNSSIIHY